MVSRQYLSLLERRAAAEPVIGNIKAEHRMGGVNWPTAPEMQTTSFPPPLASTSKSPLELAEAFTAQIGINLSALFYSDHVASGGLICVFHGRTRPRLCGRSKGGQSAQALGRSKGGFSTKIHLKTDFRGLPLAFELTGGEASNSLQFPILLDAGP